MKIIKYYIISIVYAKNLQVAYVVSRRASDVLTTFSIISTSLLARAVRLRTWILWMSEGESNEL